MYKQEIKNSFADLFSDEVEDGEELQKKYILKINKLL